MKRKVPFIPNSPDNMHCVNAVFRMLYKHFFNEDLTWEEIDMRTKAVPGKATWTFMGEMTLAKRDIEVINIEPVDYEELYKEGVEYLHTVVGQQNAEYYVTRSNIESVLEYIPEYLKYVTHETHNASPEEIIVALNKGYLIGAEVNSSILNKKDGFDLHFVLLYDFDGENIILHDPGLPAIEGRKMSLEEFSACFGYEGASQGITLFKKKN